VQQGSSFLNLCYNECSLVNKERRKTQLIASVIVNILNMNCINKKSGNNVIVQSHPIAATTTEKKEDTMTCCTSSHSSMTNDKHKMACRINEGLEYGLLI
jgi:hypothetical protein